MELKEFDIMLDIKKSKKIEDIEVVQKDYESNILNISIVEGFEPYNLSGLSVEIAFAKPDGTTVLQDEENGVIIEDPAEGKIRCILNTNTIAASGKVFAEVRILQDLRLLTTARFDFFVRRAIVNDETIESTNEFPILNQLINTTQDLIEQVGQIEQQVPENVVTQLNEVSDLANQLQVDLAAHKAEIATQEELGHVKLPENWIEATLQNDWTQPGTSTSRLSYYKDEFGTVTIAGQCTVGVDASGTVVTNLPSGYRPRASLPILIVTISGGNIIGALQITSGGELTVVSSSNVSTGNVIRILGSFKAD